MRLFGVAPVSVPTHKRARTNDEPLYGDKGDEREGVDSLAGPYRRVLEGPGGGWNPRDQERGAGD